MAGLIEIRDMCKIYNPGENEVWALNRVSLTVNEGEFVAIIGQSGSGKSTLMNMLGCLDVPTAGTYLLQGEDVSRILEEAGYSVAVLKDYSKNDRVVLAKRG